MKKVSALILLAFLTSCSLFQEKGIDFKIVNTTSPTIKNVKISTSENLDTIKFNSIPPNYSKEGFLSMKHNKIDGSYTLSFERQNGNSKEIGYGYYSNGSPLQEWMRFEITNDSTLVKFGEFPKY